MIAKILRTLKQYYREKFRKTVENSYFGKIFNLFIDISKYVEIPIKCQEISDK